MANSRTYVLSDVNNDNQVLAAVRPVMARDNRGNEVPKVDRHGVPVWEFEVMVTDPVDGVSTSRVRIPCPTPPAAAVLSPIRFGGRFTLKEWEFGGNKGVSVTAENYTQEVRPSTAPPPVPKAEAVKSAAA